MSLQLHSSFPGLNEHLRVFDGDDNVSAVEFQVLRDGADNHLKDVASIDASAFQGAADALVETMQKLALAARKAKLSVEERKRLEEAVEHQLGYVIAGYQSSIQRL